MRCYNCGEDLSKEDRCPICNVKVGAYKRAIRLSKAYYNRGLSKAKVRDLSGAVESLKVSLALDKRNVPARNLLGLVHLEMGDTVEALSQWVVSKNIQVASNPAGEYISRIQSSTAKFEQATNAVKKYNLSLRYAKEGSYDMAIIQLKKIVAANPKFIKAQQLLALLYMREREYGRARRPLNNILKTDKNNTLANVYLQEINEELQVKGKENKILGVNIKKITDSDEPRPLSGNDVIMPRSSYKEPSNGAITVINILLGVVIGVALVWFLVIPSRSKGIVADHNNEIKTYSEQLSDSNVEITRLNNELNDIKKTKDELEGKLNQISGEGGNNKFLTSLIESANYYISNDATKAAETLLNIDANQLPFQEAKTLYDKISGASMKSATEDLYNKGMAAFNANKHGEAVDYFKRSYACDNTKADAVYYIAKSYLAAGDEANAKTYYQILVDNFKSSGYFAEANAYIQSHK